MLQPNTADEILQQHFHWLTWNNSARSGNYCNNLAAFTCQYLGHYYSRLCYYSTAGVVKCVSVVHNYLGPARDVRNYRRACSLPPAPRLAPEGREDGGAVSGALRRAARGQRALRAGPCPQCSTASPGAAPGAHAAVSPRRAATGTRLPGAAPSPGLCRSPIPAGCRRGSVCNTCLRREQHHSDGLSHSRAAGLAVLGIGDIAVKQPSVPWAETNTSMNYEAEPVGMKGSRDRDGFSVPSSHPSAARIKITSKFASEN